MHKSCVCLRRPESDPELFVQDEHGTRVTIKLTAGQIDGLALNSLKAIIMRN